MEGTVRRRVMQARCSRVVVDSIIAAWAMVACIACAPKATVEVAPTPVASVTVDPSTSLVASSMVDGIDVAMNIGGSMRREDDHTVSVSVWTSDVGASSAVTFTVPLPCPSDVLSPTLVITASGTTVQVPMLHVSGDRFAGVIANDAMPTADLLTGLCVAGPDDSMRVAAEWTCGDDHVVRRVGTLRCASVDVTALVDPKGAIDIFRAGTPGGCDPLSGRKVTIYRVKTEAMPDPMPTYPDEAPAGGWTWGLVEPTEPHEIANPALLGGDDPTKFSNTSGIFAWNASDANAYFLEVMGPQPGAGAACAWYSPIFKVTVDKPILDLDLHLLTQLPPCTQNPTCPK